MAEVPERQRLIRSKRRVAEHGEVFTPAWMVRAMLDLVGDESRRIDSRFLEPACGSGNFLVPVLRRKLQAVEARFGASDFERRHYALVALMSIYGIEILADNAAECRENLFEVFADFLGGAADEASPWQSAARAVLAANVVQGDALTMTTGAGRPIVFPEWSYLGKGLFQRRDFLYGKLAQRASFAGTLWDEFREDDAFKPTRTYPPMSVSEISS